MNLSKQIKKLREEAGYSQEELSEKIYVSRQTISNWENERSYPDIHNLLLLSVLFNVTLDELVKGDVETMKKVINLEGLDGIHSGKTTKKELSNSYDRDTCIKRSVLFTK